MYVLSLQVKLHYQVIDIYIYYISTYIHMSLSALLLLFEIHISYYLCAEANSALTKCAKMNEPTQCY